MVQDFQVGFLLGDGIQLLYLLFRLVLYFVLLCVVDESKIPCNLAVGA
jgi:hypothetical protein